MTAASRWNLISVEDYLAGEPASPIKHEYVGGVVHAMAGERVGHDDISSNIHISVGVRLQGKPCRAYTSDMKIRIDLGDRIRFYYPDVSVVCRSNPKVASYQNKPAVLFEVLSNDTRRVDLGEKMDAYLKIPSLHVYVLVEQESPLVVALRRTATGFDREIYEGLDAVLPLPEIDAELPLAEIYAGVEFTPEASDEDEA